MKTMILSRFSSCKRLRQRAVPSPFSNAELKVGWSVVCGVGEEAVCACHKKNALHSPMTSKVKKQCTTTAASVRLGKHKRCQGCLPSLKMPYSMTLRQS